MNSLAKLGVDVAVNESSPSTVSAEPTPMLKIESSPKSLSVQEGSEAASEVQSKSGNQQAERPPPGRYAAAYKERKAERKARVEEEDLFGDILKVFDIGKKAVKEVMKHQAFNSRETVSMCFNPYQVFAEVKQSVVDLHSKEVRVTFLSEDAKLGLRVERRPVDDACEVTFIEAGSAAELRGVLEDDVVIGVNGRLSLGYDQTLRLLTRGDRPMELLLLRPQHILNSPLHFKLEVMRCRVPLQVSSH